MQEHGSGQELTPAEVATWTAEWDEVQERIGPRFARSEQRQRARRTNRPGPTGDLPHPDRGASGSSLVGLVWGPDRHAGPQRRDAALRPGGRSVGVACGTQKGARPGHAAALGHARETRSIR